MWLLTHTLYVYSSSWYSALFDKESTAITLNQPSFN